jgi:hypothetical protein
MTPQPQRRLHIALQVPDIAGSMVTDRAWCASRTQRSIPVFPPGRIEGLPEPHGLTLTLVIAVADEGRQVRIVKRTERGRPTIDMADAGRLRGGSGVAILEHCIRAAVECAA